MYINYTIQHLRFQFICLFSFIRAQKIKELRSTDTVIVPQQTVYAYNNIKYYVQLYTA